MNKMMINPSPASLSHAPCRSRNVMPCRNGYNAPSVLSGGRYITACAACAACAAVPCSLHCFPEPHRTPLLPCLHSKFTQSRHCASMPCLVHSSNHRLNANAVTSTCIMTVNSILVWENKLCYAVCQHAQAIHLVGLNQTGIAMYRNEADATNCRARVAHSQMWSHEDLPLPLTGALYFEK